MGGAAQRVHAIVWALAVAACSCEEAAPSTPAPPTTATIAPTVDFGAPAALVPQWLTTDASCFARDDCAAVWSPDGRLLLFVGTVLHAIDAEGGHVRAWIELGDRAWSGVGVLSTDGETLWARGAAVTLATGDVHRYEPTAIRAYAESVHATEADGALLPGGERVVVRAGNGMHSALSSIDGTVIASDLGDGQQVMNRVLDPTGRTFVVVTPTEAILRSSEDGAVRARIAHTPPEHPVHVTYAPDGSLVGLTSDGDDWRIVRPDTGEVVVSATHAPGDERWIQGHLSPSGTWVLLETDAQWAVLDLATQTITRRIDVCPDGAWGGEESAPECPEGTEMLARGLPLGPRDLVQAYGRTGWRTVDLSAPGEARLVSSDNVLAVRPDGAVAFVGRYYDSTLGVGEHWLQTAGTCAPDVRRGRDRVELTCSYHAGAIDAEGRIAASNGCENVRAILDVPDVGLRFVTDHDVCSDDAAQHIDGRLADVSTDGTRLLGIGYGGASLVELASGTQIGIDLGGDEPRDGAFSPDGASAIVATSRRLVRLDTTTATASAELRMVGAQALAYLPDGHGVLVVGARGGLTLHDAVTLARSAALPDVRALAGPGCSLDITTRDDGTRAVVTGCGARVVAIEDGRLREVATRSGARARVEPGGHVVDVTDAVGAAAAIDTNDGHLVYDGGRSTGSAAADVRALCDDGALTLIAADGTRSESLGPCDEADVSMTPDGLFVSTRDGDWRRVTSVRERHAVEILYLGDATRASYLFRTDAHGMHQVGREEPYLFERASGDWRTAAMRPATDDPSVVALLFRRD